MKIYKSILCFLLGHYVKRARSKPAKYIDYGYDWTITCGRCGKKEEYFSPCLRLYGKEILLGWKPRK
jgi:hypothetical protein